MHRARVSLFSVLVLICMLAVLWPTGSAWAAPQMAQPGLNLSQAHGAKSHLKTHQKFRPAGTPGGALLASQDAIFAKQIIGTTSLPVQVTITNSSATVPTTIFSVVPDDTNSDFAITQDGCSNSTLQPGGNCSITINWTPSTICDDSATITVNSNDPASPLDVFAFGEGASAGGIVTDDLTDPKLDALKLAQAIVGPGVSVSNVTYTGALDAAGLFTDNSVADTTGAGLVGFPGGIILSSGSISNVIGPNCDSGISTENFTSGDPDLTNLIGTNTNDAAVLEFDFVPTSPNLSFQYAFSSDEYNEFVFQFNDVFAFFLTDTTTGQVTNVALLPGTTTPVSINNVNDGSSDPAFLAFSAQNPQFFINNDFQVTDGVDTAPLNLEMDGLTTPLTASVQVVPGRTYHIKLAIADAIDDALDSNVFIEQGSLTSSQLSAAPGTLVFGNQATGSAGTPQTITLTNVGNAPLTGISASFAFGSGQFQFNNQCPASLAAGASCAVTVTFVSQAGGTQSDSLVFTDSAQDQLAVTVNGTGINGPFISFSPTTLNFGAQAVDSTSAAKTITVTNIGPQPLIFNSISLGSTVFAETDNCLSFVAVISIPPNGTCTINVTFTPATAGPQSTLLVVSDNAQLTSPTTVLVAGIGGTSALTVAPPNLSFGNADVNSTTASQTVTLTNTDPSITISILSVATSANFNQTNNCTVLNPSTSAPSNSCTISVSFTPTSATSFSGSLTITTDYPVNGAQSTVGLTGTGVNIPPVTEAPSSLAFPTTVIGQQSSPMSVTLTVANVPGLSAKFTSFFINSSDDEVANFVVGTGANAGTCVANASVAAGASCTVNVQFAPTGTGQFIETLNIPYTASFVGQAGPPFTGTFVIELRGTGTNATFTLGLAPGTTGTVSTSPGGNPTYGVVVTGTKGITQTITFTCAGPTGSTSFISCNVTPNSVTLTASGPTQVAIVVNTFCTGNLPAGGPWPRIPGGWLILPAIALLMIGMVLAYRRQPRWALALAVLMLFAIGGAACAPGKAPGDPPTPPGTYPITLTATSNGASQMLDLTMIVN
ncbi:MAG: choice-of-anchor L domain-containing protein [Candidatus Acidiferrales bacterium]